MKLRRQSVSVEVVSLVSVNCPCRPEPQSLVVPYPTAKASRDSSWSNPASVTSRRDARRTESVARERARREPFCVRGRSPSSTVSPRSTAGTAAGFRSRPSPRPAAESLNHSLLRESRSKNRLCDVMGAPWVNGEWPELGSAAAGAQPPWKKNRGEMRLRTRTPFGSA